MKKYFTSLSNKQQLQLTIKQGPRGPWVAHLRKRSKVIEKPIIENPRDII